MDTNNYFSLPQAAPMLGVCYMTVHRWVHHGKLIPAKVWGRQVVSLDQLRLLAVHRCSNCYHQKHEDSTKTCACREISDMEDGCKDWVWKWS
jgi:hypothetical protein